MKTLEKIMKAMGMAKVEESPSQAKDYDAIREHKESKGETFTKAEFYIALINIRLDLEEKYRNPVKEKRKEYIDTSKPYTI